ncbi:hypothetical protein NDU88_003374 [Pleurodeles waltl]|uniref:Uncharacterized protein n=1 Tax=Pleurodeles waltl TaxID=8319 RepID=A0AAV7KX96_PLEWA|nr:hypothetical protein NDU88_003374 [Pleurodeles waltl]
MPGAAHRPIRDLGRNPAVIPRVQARAGAHKSVGGRPSSPGRTSRSPSALRHGEPPSPARHGPARRQGRGLSPQSRAAPATREPAPGGESAPPRSPPVRSSRPTPLWARDRPIQRVQAPI